VGPSITQDPLVERERAGVALMSGSVGVLYPRYRGSRVTAQKSGYDWFTQVTNGWKIMHPVPGMVPPLMVEEVGLPT
jgi:hypothetical protein